MSTKTLIIVLFIITFPFVLIGSLAWLVWTGLAMGWNAVDEVVALNCMED